MEKLIIKQVSNVLTDEHVFVEFEGTEWTYRQVAEYLLPPEVKYCFVVDGRDVAEEELDTVVHVDYEVVLYAQIKAPVVYAFAVIWSYLATAYAAGGIFAAVVNAAAYAAAMTAISYGLNALFGPKPQKPNSIASSDLTTSQSYGWNPAITQQEGVIVPKYYGTMVANSGNVITAYRDKDGVIPDVNTGAAREAIRCAVSYGFGPIKGIREVKINDQYLDENTGLVVQRRYGFTSQSRIAAIEDFTTTEDTPGYNVSTTCALYEHPIPAGTHAFEVVLHFPSGLYQYRDDGSKEGYPAQFEMYWYNVTTSTIIKPFITDSGATITKFARWSYGYYGPFGEDASGNWTLKGWREIEAWYEEDLPYDMANYSNSVEGFDCYWRKITVEEQLPDTQATTYKTMTGPVYAATDVTFRFTLPYADGHSFKFYIRRIDAPDTLKQMASAYVSAIRYKTYRFTTYPRNVVLAISGIATERFNNDLDISAIIDGAIVNTYNGTSWTLQHSSNPAWIAWDVLTQPVYTNRSPIAENWGSWLGYDDILTLNRYDGFQPSQLNLNDFYAWAQFCDTLVSDGAGGTEKRFVANCVFDTDMSLWDAVTKFCENYRALIYWNGSEIRLCGDFGATSVSQRFNDGNIIADSLSISYIPKDTRANEVELSYLEEGNDNKRTVLALYDPEIEGGNKSQVTLFGTTRASEAWRIGKYLLACNKYINRIVKFSTSYEALHSALGDVIEIQHSMPDWAAGGRIASYNSATKIFYIDGLLLGDSEYLAMGFSQATIDGWRAGGAGQVINNQVDTGLTIGIRTLNGAYAEYAVYGGGWLNGQTQIILPVATSATGSPQLGDLYCLVGDVALQKFKITDISIENDNTVSITAVDYNEQIYVEADDCTGVTAPVLTLPDKFPNVTNITAATYAKLSAGAYTRALEVRWTIPISAYFAKVRVYLSYGSSATVLTNIAEFIGETTGTQYRLENAPVAEYYRVHVATVNTLGNEEPLSMCPSIGWEASDVNEVTIPYMATGVNELRVINSIGDGLTFNTPGCVIGWNAPEAAWADEKWLAYYEVNIYQTGTATVLHTAQVKGSREYTFAFDTNVACTGGPYRTFDIGVRAVDGLLNIGTELKITAVNAQPMAVQNVTGNDFVGGATISWELLTAPDVAGYIVGYSANAGGPFMQLRQVGKDTASCEVYLEDGIWFFVVGGYDVFGTTGINYSTAISVAISHEISIANVVDFEEGLSDVYAVPIPRGVVWSVAANVLSWNAHEIIYSGTVYSIAAGSTSLASPYVYWQSLAGSYATTASLDTFNGLLPTSNQWQIAINYGAYYKLAWVAQANQVIGSAWIGEAAIQNVNIGNEIWSNNFSYTPGSSMSGWKISKSGKIMANDLEIYASDGTLLIDGNWKNNWSSVIDDGGKPADNATANNVFYQDSAPTGTYGDIWVRTTDNQIFTHDGAVWVEGKSGASSLQVVLSNEAHVLPASSTGTVSSYLGSGTTIKVYEGATELSYDGAGTANGTWKVTTTSSGITRGTLTDSGSFLTVGVHSNMTTDTATISYAITGKTSAGVSFSMTKVQSFAKSRAGEQGIQGVQGIKGDAGADGITYYTWVKYADTPYGDGISDYPDGKLYIGLAYNKTSPVESEVAEDYSWILFKGQDGLDGQPGADGVTYYTWVKYADTPTTGMSDSPTGKAYIGLAVNKTTPTESTVYGDYSWSLTKGEDAQYVIVNGEQAFKFLAGMSAPTSETITLSASLFGGLTTYDWEYWNGTSWVNLSGTQTAPTYSLTYYNAAWGSNTSLRVRCLSGTKHDEITIVKLYDGTNGENGAAGASAYTVVLSNEAHTVACDATGAALAGEVGSTGKAKSDIKVYKGTALLTPVADGTTPVAGQFRYTIGTPAGGTAARLDNDTFYLNTITADSGSIPITVYLEGLSVAVSKSFTFSKAKTGPAGPAIVLVASNQAFTSTDNVLDASQPDITFTVVKHNTTETVTWTSVPSLVSGTGDSNTLSAASFGANTQVVVTVTTPRGLTDKITIVRLNKSTAAAGATVGATWGLDIANMPANLTSYTENAVTKIYFPIGATYSNPNSSVAGVIKIVLPQGWTATMLRFEVDVYTYSADKSFKLLLAGYNYAGGSWENTTVGLLGSVASDNRVRFAYDSALGKCCILIGSTTADGGASSWSYPKVAVSNFQAGYGSYYDKQYWETGWSISIVDSLANITSVVNWDDALVDAKSTTYVGGSLATTVESNAAEAKADADSALSQLTDMASDSKLTPVEKQAIKVEWDGIVAEKTLYDSQANAFRIIAEKASYGTAYTTLSNYITPLLSSLTTTSTIVGTTFRANFASYYSARQTLLNKISSTSASVGPNICPNPDLKGDLTNTITAPGWRIITQGTPLYSLRYVTSDALAPPWDRQQPVFYSDSDSADDSTWWYSNLIPISETETYCLSVWVRQQSATARVYLRLTCYASDGATFTGYCHVLEGYTGLSSTWTQYYDAFGPAGTLAIPANTRYCRIEWFGAHRQVGASMATRFCLNRGTIPNNAVVPSDLVGLSNPITEANHGTYIKYLTADTVVAGALRGINVNSSSHTCRGTYLTSGTASGNTTIYVHNTTDFGTSGSGYILDRLNDKDEFTWTGKTTTTLTGCSGVLDHNANATVIPKAPNIVLDKLSQELRIYGYNSTSNGYTACDQLVTLGIKDFGDGGSGADTAIARFGNETFSRGLAAYFENNNTTVATVRIQNFQSSYNTTYSSLYVYGCDTATQIGGYGIYGVGKRAIVAYGYEYDFYASGPGTNGPFTGSHDALLPNTTLAAIGDIVCDTLVVYRRNISNTLTSVDISEAPKVKSVMGVLNNILSFYITAPLQYNSLSDFLYATTAANLPATMYEDIYTNVSIDNWEDYAAAFIHYVNNYSYIIVNALGEGQINVVAEGGNIEAGDYICSSSTPGKGMKQDDDLLHNYTVAKAREDVTWTEEEIANNVVKMIACTYHCG